MESLEFGWKLVQQLVDKEQRKRELLKEQLQGVLELCRTLITLEDPDSDEAAFIHEQLKELYELASGSMQLGADDLYTLCKALSSARVYYWVRRFEGVSESEIRDVLAERRALDSLSRSCRVLQTMLEDEVNNVCSSEHPSALAVIGADNRLELVKEACLRDIGRLAALELVS